MKIKVIALLCLMALIITGLVSCGGKTDSGDKDSGKIDTSDAKKIENISEYVLVKAAGSSQRIKDASRILKEAIKNATSANLMEVVDTRQEEKYEVLIGNTSRDGIGIDTSKLGSGEFVIKLVGDKLVILGGSEVAVTKGVQCFIDNYINGKDGVYAPTGDGLQKKDENVYSKIEVDGKPLSGFVISGELYEIEEKHKPEGSTSVMESERLAIFAQKLEEAAYISLPVVNSGSLSTHEGNYIFLDDTNPDFSSYEIKVEEGNIILYANYYSLDDCINSFFADILGYDFATGKITGSRELNITEGKKFDVEKSEVYTKDELFDLLWEIYEDDSMLIVGQQMNQGLPIGEVFDYEMAQYKAGCGVAPALLGWDVVGTMIYPANQDSLESARVKIAYQMVEYMRSGGIITLSPHYWNPADENPTPATSIKGELGHEDKWDELFTEGTDINKRFMGQLEQMADFFEILKQNGAPIIFRNLLECNGNWTWYGIGQTDANGSEKKLDPQYVKRLWVLIYDYLVKERGIDNLIWEYAPNVGVRGGKTYTGDVMDCYPGDDYVDIVAVDWYPSEMEQGNPVDLLTSYEDLTKTGKLFVFGELSAGDNRTVGDNYTFTCEDYSALLMSFSDKGIKMAYTLAWSSWDTAEGRVKLTMYEMSGGDRFYMDSDVYLDMSETYELLYN